MHDYPEVALETFALEKAIPLKQCLKLLGRAGKRPHIQTARRWIKIGVRLPCGEVLRLKAARVGGEYLLMPGWCEAFNRRRLLAGLGV